MQTQHVCAASTSGSVVSSASSNAGVKRRTTARRRIWVVFEVIFKAVFTVVVVPLHVNRRCRMADRAPDLDARGVLHIVHHAPLRLYGCPVCTTGVFAVRTGVRRTLVVDALVVATIVLLISRHDQARVQQGVAVRT